MSIKAKAPTVYQANRGKIQKEKAEKEPNRKIEKKYRWEHTQAIGLGMSFVFNDKLKSELGNDQETKKLLN